MGPRAESGLGGERFMIATPMRVRWVWSGRIPSLRRAGVEMTSTRQRA
jgi:hypothetical protein